MPNSLRYPKPGEVGGQIIRKVISFLKAQELELPLTSDILIATSAGADSVALAHLLVHFGRRVVPRQKLVLLHINHGWRGYESDEDARLVQDLGSRWGVPVVQHTLDPNLFRGDLAKGDSLEDLAREERKRIYDLEAKNRNARIFTAHHADDLAETFLWRLLTGAAKTHGGGIYFEDGFEMRPCLRLRKSELKAYLKEVGQDFREDSTNSSGRFLRSRMRRNLMPELEELFPRGVEHMVQLALDAQKRRDTKVSPDLEEAGTPLVLFQAAGLKLRRNHWEMLFSQENFKMRRQDRQKEIHLPGGWRLIYEKFKNKLPRKFDKAHSKHTLLSAQQRVPKERWILERVENC